MANVLGKLSTSTGPWMAVAVIMVGGFMYWLYSASSAIESAPVTTDTVTVALPRVTGSEFAGNPERFSGRRVLVTPVTVSERLGRATLALALPERPGYPAILDRNVLESEISVVPGDNLSIAGWVYALNDSILNVWAQRNLFDQPNRPKLEGKRTFFLVDSLDFVFPEEQPGAPGS